MQGRSATAALVATATILILVINHCFHFKQQSASLPTSTARMRAAAPAAATEVYTAVLQPASTSAATMRAAAPLAATKESTATAAGDPIAAVSVEAVAAAVSSTMAAAPTASAPVCGDDVCSPSETRESCFADCPGITTPEMCGEEPHADPGGEAVAWGLTHRTGSAAECCQRCATHAAEPANKKKPCNSWVFCNEPQCWSLDNGHNHTFGECWLKWQVDAAAPLYGQRGKYSEEFRRKHRHVHRKETKSLLPSEMQRLISDQRDAPLPRPRCGLQSRY